MNKYVKILMFNLKMQMNFKVDFFFSLFSFAVHVFVFNELWDFILKDKQILGYTKPDLIWYIIIGEMITYSVSKNYKYISDMIKNGDIANLLTKPVDIFWYFVAQEATFVYKLVVNGFMAVILGVIMAGPIHFGIVQFVMFILSVMLSIIIATLIKIAIGFSAFITEENRSLSFVVSKLTLLIILTPVEFYPQVLQIVFRLLPTTYVSYAPGKILVDYDLKTAVTLILSQLASIVVVIIIVTLLKRKGVRDINVNGG